ncbi:MAG: glycoside hydrolase family 3 [Ktedonobacteraceae bacterium]|nr:glycoside hydrolase family 3 [Ktedonobacteraceae bacterium]
MFVVLPRLALRRCLLWGVQRRRPAALPCDGFFAFKEIKIIYSTGADVAQKMQQQKRAYARLFAPSFLFLIVVTVTAACAPLADQAQQPTQPTQVTLDQDARGHPISPKSDAATFTTEAALRAYLARVQQIMRGMTLEQKLGQLIIVEYTGANYQASGLYTMISQQYVGGFMYQESNHNFDPPCNQEAAVMAFSRQAQADARIPLLIATDQEGGLVNRLYRFHGYLPSAQEMAASGDPAVVRQQGTQTARWLRELGINADLAPVVDVHATDPAILATRMFGRNPQTVATYASAFLAGLQENRVAGTLKHFPGLGSITSDPHDGLPIVRRSMTDLENIDLAPYKLMIKRDKPAMIMSTDVLMPAIDPELPAELSPKAIDGLLRGQLGYDGVVITDGLYMKGISDRWTLSEAAVLAIIAGNDLIEGPYSPATVAAVVDALKLAIQDGRLTMARIDQSVARILLMKLQYGIIQ